MVWFPDRPCQSLCALTVIISFTATLLTCRRRSCTVSPLSTFLLGKRKGRDCICNARIMEDVSLMLLKCLWHLREQELCAGRAFRCCSSRSLQQLPLCGFPTGHAFHESVEKLIASSMPWLVLLLVRKMRLLRSQSHHTVIFHFYALDNFYSSSSASICVD